MLFRQSLFQIYKTLTDKKLTDMLNVWYIRTMTGNKKLSLEWIPDAYSAKENILPKKEIAGIIKGDNLIVKSTGLYRAKKLGIGHRHCAVGAKAR
jgi:hypothetical protein